MDLPILAGGQAVFLLEGTEEGGIVAEACPFRHTAQIAGFQHQLPGPIQPLLGDIAVKAHAQAFAAQMGHGAFADVERPGGVPDSDPFLQALFAAAEKLEMPVTIHMSPEVGYSYGVVDEPGLPLLEQVLQKFPNLKLLGHSQTFWIEMSGDAPTDKEGRNSWGQGPVVPGGRVPALFAQYPNLYGDLSANSAGQAIMRDEAFGLAFLEKYADRLFFATDMVNTDMVFPLGGWLDEQLATGKLSRRAYDLICFGNAQRVFGL